MNTLWCKKYKCVSKKIKVMSENYSRRYAKDFNWKKRLFQLWAVYCVCMPIFWFFYKYEIKGRENIPKNKKFICSANHISEFDPFLVSIAIRKPIAFMAKIELFNTPIKARLMTYLASFAVNREKMEVSTLRTVKEILKTNWFLGIFPEGGIKKNKSIDKINKGFAVIAKASKSDVLPIAITGCEEYNWVPFKSKIIVEVGELISHEQEVDEIIDEWGAKVAKMAKYDYISTIQEKEELINA